MLLGGVAAGVVGLGALVAVGTGQVSGGTGAPIAAGVLGAIFLLIGLFPVVTCGAPLDPARWCSTREVFGGTTRAVGHGR